MRIARGGVVMEPKTVRKPPGKLSQKDAIKTIDEEIARLRSNIAAENTIALLKKIAEIRKQAKAIDYKEGIVEAYIASAVINRVRSDFNEEAKNYHRALKLAEKISYRKGIAYGKMGATRVAYVLDGKDSTESIIATSEVLSLARKENDQYLEWQALALLSSIYGRLGEISRGFTCFEEALAIAEKRGDARDIVSTIIGGASSLLAPALYEKHLRRAVELTVATEQNAHAQSFAFFLYAGVLLNLGRYDEADAYINRVRELLPSLRPVREGAMRASIGSYYLDRGLESKAKEEFQRALPLGMNPGEALFVNAELGRMHAKSDPQKALQYFEEGLRLLSQHIDLDKVHQLHGYLADFYLSIGESEKALQHYALYKTITEENIKKEDRQRAEYAEMILRFDRSQKHEKQLEEEVEEKSAALTSKAMLLAEQTELLSNFRNDLRAILRKVEVNDPAINEIRKKLRELPEAVNWSEFDEQFQSVHPGFQSMLSANYPSLSKMELKNCVLLRLGLNSLDISKLLSLSKRTTEWHRHNIRKKLGIKPDADVAQFMQRL